MANIQFKMCAVYTRVSTDIQAEKEFSSCEAQEEKIKHFVESQNDFSVFKVYSDAGYTGANTNRPALQELLNDIKEGRVDLVLAYKIDRLTRSPKDFYELIETFDRFGVDFISITERFDTSTPAGRLLRNIMLTFAQFERELTSERTKDKMLERAKKGMSNGGFAPYGYSRKDKKIFINKKEAETVRSIFSNYVETGSLSKVYNYLAKSNLKNRNGKPFTKTAIAYMLRNVIYTGKISHKGEFYPGLHQPIISQEVFGCAQQTHKKKTNKNRIYKNHLFGGIINCADCGAKMTPSYSNKTRDGKFQKRYYYYRCTSTLKNDWQSCETKQVNADRLDRYVLENLERISNDKEYVENLVFRINHAENSGYRIGYEPSAKTYDLTAEKVISTLKAVYAELGKRTGIAKNLLAKRFFKEIVYAKESIKITLFLLQNQPVLASGHSPRQGAPSAQNFLTKRADLIPPFQQNEFVLNNSAAGLGFEPR
ncbi:MAG: recombinase family protein [Candidatus Pacebacteria bacterium]|nr:recombinase family protein [Candidatus Paceibacterota bacterium]